MRNKVLHSSLERNSLHTSTNFAHYITRSLWSCHHHTYLWTFLMLQHADVYQVQNNNLPLQVLEHHNVLTTLHWSITFTPSEQKMGTSSSKPVQLQHQQEEEDQDEEPSENSLN